MHQVVCAQFYTHLVLYAPMCVCPVLHIFILYAPMCVCPVLHPFSFICTNVCAQFYTHLFYMHQCVCVPSFTHIYLTCTKFYVPYFVCYMTKKLLSISTYSPLQNISVHAWNLWLINNTLEYIHQTPHIYTQSNLISMLSVSNHGFLLRNNWFSFTE